MDECRQDEHCDDIAKRNADDFSLFRRAVKDVRPLNKVVSTITQESKAQSLASTLKLRRKLAVTECNRYSLFNNNDISPIAPEEHISFRHPSVSSTWFKSFQKGQPSIEYILDLHGYSIANAKNTIEQFIYFCQNNHYRYVQIIHGKSHKAYAKQITTMKSLVAFWLTQLAPVLAYLSCLPQDGGRGAVYVLLKKQVKKKSL